MKPKLICIIFIFLAASVLQAQAADVAPKNAKTNDVKVTAAVSVSVIDVSDEIYEDDGNSEMLNDASPVMPSTGVVTPMGYIRDPKNIADLELFGKAGGSAVITE